ncbi:rhomboid family intramembrane serine protease [Halomicroarcula sp. GCM10025709]|uniref:rhomboid family intramembrane serine protease n=1 Tax=Haloarcula TaxID=2237 RepID=UPI0024C21308|nr:rhomboid family intramembrane serine protease [Halomicroarcula sp. YJ-61-S]
MPRLTESPTVVTLGAIGAVFALQQVVGLILPQTLVFGMSRPVAQPWTLVTSVYAHGGPSHLLSNAVALAVLGFLLERETTSLRYHTFFVLTGTIAGLAEVYAARLLGPVVPWMVGQVNVLGASGAIFAFLGYLLASNRLTETVVGGVSLSPRAQLALGGLCAAAITIATANPGVALIAHFTGLLLGFLAGRAHLLRPGTALDGPEPTNP